MCYLFEDNMRVIEIGKARDEEEKFVTCNRCLSKLGFFARDTHGYYSSPDRNRKIGCFLACPICSYSAINVEISEIDYTRLQIERK